MRETYISPSPEEIEEHIRAARKARADAIAHGLVTALRWVAHPRRHRAATV